METTTKTAKEIYFDIKRSPGRARFGFGNAVLVNIDPQKAYTATDELSTAYETDPQQLHYINKLSEQFRLVHRSFHTFYPYHICPNIL